VALAFTVPVYGPGGITPAERFEHMWRPVSAGFAVPVFAFFASGVAIGGRVGAVTLLISELAFGAGTTLDDQSELGVLSGSVLAALFASVLLRLRNRPYRSRRAAEEPDGVPDSM
jgi:NhaA family Na+:H+ antiporter